MGKIAAGLHRALAERAARGAPGGTTSTELAGGDGWTASDVICTSGPADRPFEEQHRRVSIGIVVAGSFQYRSARGHGLLAPGSLMLGNAGECFECGHEHAEGDRCIAFNYSPAFFERIASDAGLRRGGRPFGASRLPPLRETSALVARAATGASRLREVSWEETAIEVAAVAVRASGGVTRGRTAAPPGALARVTESVRRIESDPGAPTTLAQLAEEAGQSPFHYLRTFRQLTGVTPHQFMLRTRLREAAARLLAEDARVIEIALAAGFGDVSNFNRSFRAEFGVTPTEFRRRSVRR